MLWSIIKFEIRYRLNRPATYIYFFIFFLLAFLAVSWEGLQFGGDIGKIKQNASSVLFSIASVFGLIPGMFIASAVMGVPILRDFEHKMESFIFTTNITKTSYLLGRFTGSFLILLIISTGFFWGGYLGCLMPWVDRSRYLPVSLGQFCWPWLIMIVCNMFVFSCLFFACGALTRKMLFVYLQAIVLLALYITVDSLAGNIENMNKAALIDPFGNYTVQAVTRYWTVAEKNTLIVPFSGLLLINRLIWVGAAVVFLLVTFVSFRFRSVYTGVFKKKSRKSKNAAIPANQTIPFIKPVYNTSTWLKQVTVLTKIYFKEIFRSVPFIGMGLVGVVLIAVNAAYASTFYGQELYPLSSNIAAFIASQVGLIISIMVLFYSGELVWKERDVRFNQIFDALPASDTVPVISKFLALSAVLLVYLFFMIPIGMLIQLFKGFSFIEPGVYIKILLLRVYVPMLIYTAMTLFVQSLSSNRFIGYAISILFYIYILFANQIKVFYNLFIPNSGQTGPYSDMNGFAAGSEKFWVLKAFWIGVSGLLLVIAVLFYQRGTDNSLRTRLFNSKQRFRRPQVIVTLICLLLALSAASYYYINTNVWNRYINPQQEMDIHAAYEKELKPGYEKMPQPSVVNIKGQVDLFPENGDLNMKATITYKNLLPDAITKLFLQSPEDNNFNFTKMDFNVPAKLVKSYPDYKVKIYQLITPLQPGDSLELQVAGNRIQKGFVNGTSDGSYVNNGTFINNGDFLPFIGYQNQYELPNTDDRKKRGLKEQKGLAPRTDTIARRYNLFAQRGRTRLDMVISTAPDQIAMSPGYLKKKWIQNGRAYFEYQMDQPIFNFFNIISGRYTVKQSKWKGVNLEIYYHKDHPFNLDVMMQSLKDGLDYNNTHFSPYLYRQMRIIEYPRYRSFAQSFPNTVPFSESIGFVFRRRPEKLDMCYYVTAHELGHQWWAHQVCEANTAGAQMFSESLSQYSSLMLLKKSLPIEELRRYLKYELDGYLNGRSAERKNENPLDQTDNQGYIHYQKGSLANFAMQDYIGEENMNKALRKLIANYANGDQYPTTDVLTSYIREVTPDSLKYVVDDLYSRITLFENRVISPTAKKVKNGYEVIIPVQAVKYYADRDGNEKRTPVKDYIDIGIFAMVNDKEKLVYLKREKFSSEQRIFNITLKEKPIRAGIDPVYKLIDRNTEDNTAVVEIP